MAHVVFVASMRENKKREPLSETLFNTVIENSLVPAVASAEVTAAAAASFLETAAASVAAAIAHTSGILSLRR